MRAAKAAAGSRKGSKTKIFRIKIISMGDQALGKSCLIKRYVGKAVTRFPWNPATQATRWP